MPATTRASRSGKPKDDSQQAADPPPPKDQKIDKPKDDSGDIQQAADPPPKDQKEDDDPPKKKKKSSDETKKQPPSSSSSSSNNKNDDDVMPTPPPPPAVGPIFYGPEYGVHPSTKEHMLIPQPFAKEIDSWTPKIFVPTPGPKQHFTKDVLPKLFCVGRIFIKIEQLIQAVHRILARFGKPKSCARVVDHYHCTIDLTSNKSQQWKIITKVINPKPRHFYLKIVKSELVVNVVVERGNNNNNNNFVANNNPPPAMLNNLEAWVSAQVQKENEMNSNSDNNNNKKKEPKYVPSPYLPEGKPSFAMPCQMLFSTHFSDISIQCGGTKDEEGKKTTTIPAHRVILGMASPVWHNVFINKPGSKILVIPYPVPIVKEVLSVLYQGTINLEILENNLNQFRDLSRKFAVDCIPRLIHHLAYQNLTFDNLREKLLNFVHHLHDVKLIEVALTFVEKHPEQVLALDDIKSLADDHPEIWEKLVPVAVKNDKKRIQELLSKTTTLSTTTAKLVEGPAGITTKRQKVMANEFNTHRNPIMIPIFPTTTTMTMTPFVGFVPPAAPLVTTNHNSTVPAPPPPTMPRTAAATATATAATATATETKDMGDNDGNNNNNNNDDDAGIPPPKKGGRVAWGAPTNDEWLGEVILPAQLTSSSTTSSTMINIPQAFQEMNILAYLNPLYKGMRVAFDPTKYPVGNRKFSKDNKGWMELKKDILAAARKTGQELREASNAKGLKGTMALQCLRSRYYPTEKSVHKDRSPSDYRKTDSTNSNSNTNPKRKDDRPNGRRLPKNSLTSKPTNKAQCCPFRFNLGVSESCFYLSCGSGTLIHKYHAKLAAGEKMPKTLAKDAFPHLRSKDP